MQTFGLPTKGITEFNRLPSATVDEMKIKFSFSGLPQKSYGKKKEMKIEYRLLNEIVAKSLTTKARSFDSFIVERLEIVITVSARINVNFSGILFNVLVAMVSCPEKQHQGYAIMMCHLLLQLRAEMGSSTVLHALKVLDNNSI